MSDLIRRDRRACEVSFIPPPHEHALERRECVRESIRCVFFTILLLERIEKGGEPKQDPPDWLNILISLVDCMLIQHNRRH